MEGDREIQQGRQRERLTAALREKAEGGRISCALAWEIADRLGVPRGEAGRAADEAGIKITQCQLGCF